MKTTKVLQMGSIAFVAFAPLSTLTFIAALMAL